MESQTASGSTFPVSSAFNTMSDSQLRQTISQLSSYASPTPQQAHTKSMLFMFLLPLLLLNFSLPAYMKNLQTWSTTATPPPKNPATATRSTRARNTRSALASTPTPFTPPVYQPALLAAPLAPLAPPIAPNPPRPPLPTTLQALQSTYASRLRTGATLLMQPILASSSTAGTRTATRRGGVVNYADPGSGDELPDAGAIDSDDSDFVATSGTRTSARQGRSRQSVGMSVFNSTTGTTTTPHQPPPAKAEKTELDQSYLGTVPPAKFVKSKWIHPTVHVYPYVSSFFISPIRQYQFGAEHRM